MTKEHLFLLFKIDETHAVWDDSIDNWWSVELYRIMKGKLPEPDDLDCTYILGFLLKFKNDVVFSNQISQKYPKNWGNLFLTAKRSVYRFADIIIADEIIQLFLKQYYSESETLKADGLKVVKDVNRKTFLNRRERRNLNKKSKK